MTDQRTRHIILPPSQPAVRPGEMEEYRVQETPHYSNMTRMKMYAAKHQTTYTTEEESAQIQS